MKSVSILCLLAAAYLFWYGRYLNKIKKSVGMTEQEEEDVWLQLKVVKVARWALVVAAISIWFLA